MIIVLRITIIRRNSFFLDLDSKSITGLTLRTSFFQYELTSMSLLAHDSTKHEVRLSLLSLQGVLNYGEGCFAQISEVSAFSAACPGKERLLLCLVGKQVPFFFKPARRLTSQSIIV